jgi:hypothetical protein
MENLTHDWRFPSSDSNFRLPEYGARVITGRIMPNRLETGYEDV